MELKPGYKQSELGVIPEDWNCVQLPALMSQTSHSIKIGPFGSALKKELLTKEGYKVYGQENVYERNMTVGERFISAEHFRKLKSCEVKPGDFLISMMGTVGKCLVVPINIETGIMDSHLLRLRLNPSKLDAEYLSQLFQTRIISNQVKQLSVGGIMEGLSSKIIKLLQFPVPEIEEQTAIAEALSDADAFIESLEQLIAKKRNLKQGAIQELLTGKKRLPGFETKPGCKQTEVGVIPEDWESKPLDSIAKVASGKRLPLGKSLTNQETPHPYIRVIDMRPGTVSLGDIRFVPVNVFPAIKGYRIFKEDIFISVAGTLGIVGRIPRELNGANLTENADRITNISCSQDYLLHVLMSPLIQNMIDSLQTVGAQPKLALTRIRKFVIPFPPTKAEQEAIAETLSDMDAEIEALVAKRAKALQVKQGMMQELLTGRIRLI